MFLPLRGWLLERIQRLQTKPVEPDYCREYIITCFRCLVSCTCVFDFKVGLWKPWRFRGFRFIGLAKSSFTFFRNILKPNISQVEASIPCNCSRNVCGPNAEWATCCSSELFAMCGNSFSASWSSPEQIHFSHVSFSKWCYRALEHLQRRAESQTQFSSVLLSTVLWLKIILQTIWKPSILFTKPTKHSPRWASGQR